jgi:hypothetical protein
MGCDSAASEHAHRQDRKRNPKARKRARTYRSYAECAQDAKKRAIGRPTDNLLFVFAHAQQNQTLSAARREGNMMFTRVFCSCLPLLFFV